MISRIDVKISYKPIYDDDKMNNTKYLDMLDRETESRIIQLDARSIDGRWYEPQLGWADNKFDQQMSRLGYDRRQWIVKREVVEVWEDAE